MHSYRLLLEDVFAGLLGSSVRLLFGLTFPLILVLFGVRQASPERFPWTSGCERPKAFRQRIFFLHLRGALKKTSCRSSFPSAGESRCLLTFALSLRYRRSLLVSNHLWPGALARGALIRLGRLPSDRIRRYLFRKRKEAVLFASFRFRFRRRFASP